MPTATTRSQFLPNHQSSGDHRFGGHRGPIPRLVRGGIGAREPPPRRCASAPGCGGGHCLPGRSGRAGCGCGGGCERGGLSGCEKRRGGLRRLVRSRGATCLRPSRPTGAPRPHSQVCEGAPARDDRALVPRLPRGARICAAGLRQAWQIQGATGASTAPSRPLHACAAPSHRAGSTAATRWMP